jgi:four helix bundle protein
MRDDKQQQMLLRTKRFALNIISLYANLSKATVAQVLGRQVLRSGTSVGAHYREACRAKSDADFISKIEGGLQELDETAYWLELLAESKTIRVENVDGLMSEAEELIAIFVTVVKSVKAQAKGRGSSSLIPHPSSLRRFRT